jgi:hypothetical protein
MKNSIILLSLSLLLLNVCNAQVQSKKVKPKGVFKEIDVAKHNDAISNLQSTGNKKKALAIESILKNPNDFNPPVLYALSRELFQQGNKDEAAYWFYVAQIRARYDANLCLDNSAKQAVSLLNNEYGPDINKYAFQDIDKLEKTINKVVDFVGTNHENYDHRWINLHGMWAFFADNKSEKSLSKPTNEWEAIKKKTIEDYHNGFIEFVKNNKKAE